MNKTDQLNQLFDRWQTMRQYVGFKKDGIINEALFKSSHILFVCKEPNDPKQEEGDYRVWWNQEMLYTFSRRIGEWSHGIFNNFPPYESFKDEDSHLALRSIAFMNVKKVGGGSTANHNEIEKWLERDITFLKEEIEIINPKLIICCLGFSQITRALFNEVPEGDWHSTGYGVPYAELGERLIVDFYHPSTPAPGVMSYLLLEKVLQQAGYGQ